MNVWHEYLVFICNLVCGRRGAFKVLGKDKNAYSALDLSKFDVPFHEVFNSNVLTLD